MTEDSDLGEQHGYVGEAIDPNWTPNSDPVEPYHPPFPEGMKPMPEPGIYFNMSEADYHAVHALSASGIKKMIASSMEYWAYGRMNPDFEERESLYLNHGKATHCFVLEGEVEYEDRYVVELDPTKFEGENVLISTDEIKAAIGKFTELRAVAPAQGKRQDLVDQLDALFLAHGGERNLEGNMAELKDRIRTFKEDQPIKPVRKVPDEDPESDALRLANKDDWIAQLLALNPDAKIWDHMVSQHLAQHEGKTVISAKDDRRVRIAARMIEKHPDAGPMLKGGYSEVSIFWYCPVTGVPMKARIDYLKLRAVLDLKTFSNQQGKPVDKAIEGAIANYRYNVQHAHYDQAILMGRKLVAELGPEAVRDTQDAAVLGFCEQWAMEAEPPAFVFIFQQSGIAPVTRVREMPRETIFAGSMRLIENIAFQWRECAETYGTDPWLDIVPMDKIPDEAIPTYATEMRGYYD